MKYNWADYNVLFKIFWFLIITGEFCNSSKKFTFIRQNAYSIQR